MSPSWREPLPSPTEMAAWDRSAIEDFGIPGRVLMENAAREALAALAESHGPLEGKTALVLAGPGNNGGDAFALARLLDGMGASVSVLHTRPRKQYRGETRANLLLAARLGLSLELAAPGQALPEADIVVDGLLGTGFSGALKSAMLHLVREVNRLGRRAFVFSLDIPSGLDGLDGTPRPEAVRAHATVTFQAAKTGLLQPGAGEWTGRLLVRDIGIPRQAREAAPPRQWLLAPGVLDLLPRTEPAMHKGAAGRVLILGGSEGLTGAPLLASLGALRGGAGLVTLGCPAGLADAARAGFPEVMALPLGRGRTWDQDLAAALDPGRFDALVLGPGLGRSDGAGRFVQALLRRRLPPLVLDADALFFLARDAETASLVPPGSVLTPHPGEAATLLGSGTAEVQADRPAAARELARRFRAVALLKGAGSLVAAPEGDLHLCPISAPCLAAGGSGDVLAGLLGSLLGRGLSPLRSTCLAVYWHGSGGRMLDSLYPARGCLAREIADILPQVHKERPC
ncbi:NAD(P)H-hydrate dehydratase [Desulfovibrio sp.]